MVVGRWLKHIKPLDSLTPKKNHVSLICMNILLPSFITDYFSLDSSRSFVSLAFVHSSFCMTWYQYRQLFGVRILVGPSVSAVLSMVQFCCRSTYEAPSQQGVLSIPAHWWQSYISIKLTVCSHIEFVITFFTFCADTTADEAFCKGLYCFVITITVLINYIRQTMTLMWSETVYLDQFIPRASVNGQLYILMLNMFTYCIKVFHFQTASFNKREIKKGEIIFALIGVI